MALDTPIDDNEQTERQPVDVATDPFADRSSISERPYLTHDEAAVAVSGRKDHDEFDRWRHLPTFELHYYPRGIEPENRTEYVRFLP